jgi:hypothetical protein
LRLKVGKGVLTAAKSGMMGVRSVSVIVQVRVRMMT